MTAIASVRFIAANVRGLGRLLQAAAAAFFVIGGANHFLHAAFYRSIIPPGFPAPALLVLISGVCEIAGGIGLLIRPLRRAAGWGLIALLIAVFPANLYMAFYPQRLAHLHAKPWMLWARLPLQAVFIWWVWYASREPVSAAFRALPQPPDTSK